MSHKTYHVDFKNKQIISEEEHDSKPIFENGGGDLKDAISRKEEEMDQQGLFCMENYPLNKAVVATAIKEVKDLDKAIERLSDARDCLKDLVQDSTDISLGYK